MNRSSGLGEGEDPVHRRALPGGLRSGGSTRQLIRADIMMNPGHPRELIIIVSFRIARAMSSIWLVGTVLRIMHRVLTEVMFSIELKPETLVGPGLRIFHGFATVINANSIIGAKVTLRHSVTIGTRVAGGVAPVIGDGVDIGAGAMILGDVVVGAGAVIGAGSLVLHDVPAGATVVGSPAVIIRRGGELPC